MSDVVGEDHLSQDHLKEAVEDVTGFGQTVSQSPNQNGTVTKTGNDQTVKEEKEVEVIDLIGAGEGI